VTHEAIACRAGGPSVPGEACRSYQLRFPFPLATFSRVPLPCTHSRAVVDPPSDQARSCRVVARLKSRPIYAVIKPLSPVERGHRHPKAELRTYAAFVVAEVTIEGVESESAATAAASKLLKVGLAP